MKNNRDEKLLQLCKNKRVLHIGAYVDRVRDLFDEVYIYSFEEFKKDKLPIIEEMCDFMGVVPPIWYDPYCIPDAIPEYRDRKINKKWDGGKLQVGRLRNFFFKTSRYCLDKNKGGKKDETVHI